MEVDPTLLAASLMAMVLMHPQLSKLTDENGPLARRQPGCGSRIQQVLARCAEPTGCRPPRRRLRGGGRIFNLICSWRVRVVTLACWPNRKYRTQPFHASIHLSQASRGQ